MVGWGKSKHYFPGLVVAGFKADCSFSKKIPNRTAREVRVIKLDYFKLGSRVGKEELLIELKAPSYVLSFLHFHIMLTAINLVFN